MKQLSGTTNLSEHEVDIVARASRAKTSCLCVAITDMEASHQAVALVALVVGGV